MTSTLSLEQKKKADDLVDQYHTLQESFTKTQVSKQQLIVQQNENTSVQTELGVLEEDAILYKLVGPVLIKQSVTEARSTVQKRLDYIKQETERANKLMEETTQKLESTAAELEALQKSLMAEARQKQKVTA